MSNISPFDFIFKMQKGEEFNEAEWGKDYQPFLISRILSTDVRLVPALNKLNVVSELPKPMHYEFCKSLVDLIKKPYIAYGKEGLSIKKRDNTVKESISIFFETGYNDQESYLEVLEDKDVEDIVKYVERNQLR